MNYEQKYNKLVNAVKILKETNSSDEGIQKWVNENVPELAESEDEIPQKLHNLLCAEVTYEQFEKHNLTVDSALDWLEKQGNDSYLQEKIEIFTNAHKGEDPEGIIAACRGGEEQGEQKAINDTDEDIVEAVKDTSILDMVEPKFHEGDWVAYNSPNAVSPICQITKVDGDIIDLKGLQGERFQTEYWDLNENYHLWTIKDAREGDVLKEDSCMFIVEKMKSEGTAIVYCCLFDDGDLDLTGSTLSFDADSTYPATKEQRDLLFQKMIEAGYEWDAEKKELKLLITNGGDFESENCEQNPTWSAEDDRTLGYLLAVLEDGIPTDSGKMEKIVDWLRTLKQRYIWKPSEEQIKAIRLARSFVTDDFSDNPTLSEILIELEKQLKKLKGEINYETKSVY